MSKLFNPVTYVVVALLLLGISMSVFTVHEREKALKLQLGKIVKSSYEPGLHFKWPWETVKRFDNQRRITPR